MSTSSVEVVKWFTRARRFPQLIGRTPDGQRLPGGPYTVTQVVGAGAVLFAGTQTMGLWAHYGLLGNAALLLGVAYALVLVLGRIPVGSRNPLAIASGATRALSASTTGAVGGRPVRLPRPQRVRHRIVVLHQLTPPTRESTGQPRPAGVTTATRSTGEGLVPKSAPAAPAPSPTTASHVTRWRSRAEAVPLQRPSHRPTRRTGTARQAAPTTAATTAPTPAAAAVANAEAAARQPAPALSGVQALLAQAAADSRRPRPPVPPPTGSPSSPVGLLPRPARSAPVEDS